MECTVWFFRDTSVHRREIAWWDRKQTGISKVSSVLVLSRFAKLPQHLVESLVCKGAQNNREANALLTLRDWGPAHSFWKTDPLPHWKRKKHHRHFNLTELFAMLYQNVSWYFSVDQHVCSCWFLRSLNPRKTIPILSDSRELVTGNFDSDSN